MDNWDEIRTAYNVARAGTVSGAAAALGVHHATVIRHVDSLEARLGVKLFQRHAKGYSATEAGEDLLRIAAATEDQFNQLQARIKGQGEGVTGELTVTSLPVIARRVAPVMAEFARQHPGLKICYLTSRRLYRLQYGEAHVALRAGPQPDDPDNVVQYLFTLNFALYGSREYFERFGMPETIDDLHRHILIAQTGPEARAPYSLWLEKHFGEDLPVRVLGLEANDSLIRSGAGLGFLMPWQAGDDLIECFPSRPEWQAPIWLVTHVDQHRTQKVQLFAALLKERTAEW